VRFAKYITGKLMVGGYAFSPGGKAEPQSPQSDNTTGSSSAGIGVQVGTPRGQFGGFGELDFLFHHQFYFTNKFKPPSTCEETVTFNGPAVALGGGLSIPLGTSWSLTPIATTQIGRLQELKADEGCYIYPRGSTNIESGKQGTHGAVHRNRRRVPVRARQTGEMTGFVAGLQRSA
jgi:hypothetical protein